MKTRFGSDGLREQATKSNASSQTARRVSGPDARGTARRRRASVLGAGFVTFFQVAESFQSFTLLGRQLAQAVAQLARLATRERRAERRELAREPCGDLRLGVDLVARLERIRRQIVECVASV